tara:strand:+ start:1252 stop:1644 length:393 start_codon:yes stop_codon:yes gene_type:complete
MNYIFVLLLIFILNVPVKAQLKFINKDPKGSIAKFEVIGNKTLIYLKSQNPGETITHVIDDVPKIESQEQMRSNYRLRTSMERNTAKISLEVVYTLFRQTNRYTGTIRMSTYNPAIKSEELILEYFEINP